MLLAVVGMLLLGGAAALGALNRGEAPATAMVPAGAALVAGAAFYRRVRAIGSAGVKLDPATVVDDVAAQLPPPKDQSAAAERRALLAGVADGATGPTGPSGASRSGEPVEFLIGATGPTGPTGPTEVAARVVDGYARAMALEDATRDWLGQHGLTLLEGTWPVDFVAQGADRVVAVEAKAGHPADVPRLARRIRESGDAINAQLGADVECWIAVDVMPPAAYLDHFRQWGVGVVRLAPLAGLANVVVEPRSRRGPHS